MDQTVGGAGDPVLHACFSVNHLSDGTRYDVWRDSISCIFDVSRSRTQQQTEPFHATVDAYMMGGIMYGVAETTAQDWRRSSVAIGRDGMDHYMIQIQEEGLQQLEGRHNTVTPALPSVIVYDLSQELHSQTTAFRNTTLVVPRGLLENMLTAPDDQHLRVLDSRQPMAGLLRDHMLSLKRHLSGITLQQAGTLASFTADLIAACLNAEPAADHASPPPSDRVRLVALRRDIERRLADETLTPADLCTRFNLSRTRLYELFGPFGGVSAYIKERRLRAALLMLIDPKEAATPISSIARRFLFSDSDFSRAFNRRYGVSPRTARQEGLEAPGPIADQGLDRRYEHWLRSLSV